jgi:hypothetical protein
VLALRGIRGRVVPERLFTVQLEDTRCEETALGVRLAPVQIDDEAQVRARRRVIAGWSSRHGCHPRWNGVQERRRRHARTDGRVSEGAVLRGFLLGERIL